MSYFNAISFGMGTMFVRGFSEIAELLISLKRLKAFLLLEEFVPSKSDGKSNGFDKHIEASSKAVQMHNFSVKWNKSNSDLALDNVNFIVPRGHLVGIIGPVGSGKSTLLQAILGM